MKMTKMGKLPHFVAHHGIMRSNMVMEIPTHSCNTLCWRPHKFPPECLATSLRAIRVPQLRSNREMEMWASWVLGNQPTFIAYLKKLQESMIAFATQYTVHTHVNVHRYAYTYVCRSFLAEEVGFGWQVPTLQCIDERSQTSFEGLFLPRGFIRI